MPFSSIVAGISSLTPKTGRIFKPLDDPKFKGVIGDMKQGRPGWGFIPLRNGDNLIGYAPVESPKWSVAVTAPLAEFMGKINQIKVNSALVMLISMGIATFGILIIARSLSRPIKEAGQSYQNGFEREV